MSDCAHDDDLPDDWTAEQRVLFSRVLRHMVGNYPLFCHPDAPVVAAEHWQTTCWNAAWFAAHCAGTQDRLVIHCAEDGTLFGEERPLTEALN